MGQSASQPTSTRKQKNGLEGKDDVTQLGNAELAMLAEMEPWTLEAVLQAATVVKSSSSTTSASSSAEGIEQPKGYYATEDESPEVDVAVRLNSISKPIAKLRFSLVPSKLKEPIFWEAIFYILKERLKEYNSNLPSTHTDVDTTEDLPQQKGNDDVTNTNGSINGAVSTKVGKMLGGKSSITNDKDLRILELEQQVAELQAALEKAGVTLTNNIPCHKGAWIMDKDSKEFLEYPPEVKENMRREKQRRLKQVHQDMKFILDSDNVEDTHGKWACCGSTVYSSACTTKKSSTW